jgi:hypothetical protein
MLYLKNIKQREIKRMEISTYKTIITFYDCCKSVYVLVYLSIWRKVDYDISFQKLYYEYLMK